MRLRDHLRIALRNWLLDVDHGPQVGVGEHWQPPAPPVARPVTGGAQGATSTSDQDIPVGAAEPDQTPSVPPAHPPEVYAEHIAEAVRHYLDFDWSGTYHYRDDRETAQVKALSAIYLDAEQAGGWTDAGALWSQVAHRAYEMLSAASQAQVRSPYGLLSTLYASFSVHGFEVPSTYAAASAERAHAERRDFAVEQAHGDGPGTAAEWTGGPGYLNGEHAAKAAGLTATWPTGNHSTPSSAIGPEDFPGSDYDDFPSED